MFDVHFSEYWGKKRSAAGRKKKIIFSGATFHLHRKSAILNKLKSTCTLQSMGIFRGSILILQGCFMHFGVKSSRASTYFSPWNADKRAWRVWYLAYEGLKKKSSFFVYAYKWPTKTPRIQKAKHAKYYVAFRLSWFYSFRDNYLHVILLGDDWSDICSGDNCSCNDISDHKESEWG